MAGALDLPVAYLAERDSSSPTATFQLISHFGLQGRVDFLKLDLASHNAGASVFQDVKVNHLLKEKDILPWWTHPFSFLGGALVSRQSTGSIDNEKIVYTLVVLTPNSRRVISSFGECDFVLFSSNDASRRLWLISFFSDCSLSNRRQSSNISSKCWN